MSRTLLFLCPHNAAKSLLAVAYCTREAAARGLDLQVDSAGTEPDAEPAPHVVALLAGEGFDVSAHRPRRVTPQDLRNAWRVISMGCDVSAMAPADLAIEHWVGVPATDQDLQGARDHIHAKVTALVDGIAREAAVAQPA